MPLTVESCFRLRARLVSQPSGRIQWSSVWGNCTLSFERDGWMVRLTYDTEEFGEQTQTVRLTTIPRSRRRWPFFQCGGCGRRVMDLYRPPFARSWGCRTCYRLTYRKRLETPFDRHTRRYYEARDALADPSLSESERARALKRLEDVEHKLVQVDAEHSAAMLDRLQRIVENIEPGKQSNHDDHAREAPPTRVKRPPGRPTRKRRYVRRTPLTLTKRTSDEQAYCPKCRDRRDLLSSRITTFRNGRQALQGRCAICGTKTATLVKATPLTG